MTEGEADPAAPALDAALERFGEAATVLVAVDFDGVLAEIAQALREGVRDEDVVARLAGDGFGVR